MVKKEGEQTYEEAKSEQRSRSKRPELLVRELEQMVYRSEQYEVTRKAAENYFTDACVYCTRLLIYFYQQVQDIRRKEQEDK